MRVGLLGGSFNPVHEGHIQLACRALRQLRLDQVWFLVSPGNPLKPAAGMAPLAQRLAGVRARLRGLGTRRLVATDIERHIGTRYTVDTLARLKRLFPHVRFVWLMGADGLAQMGRWRRWTDLVRMVPLAVLPRPGYNGPALHGQIAHIMAPWRRPAREAGRLALCTPPAWVFLPAPQNAISATEIRASQAGSGHRRE
ncbi:nicotinate-nicotinamide nucleotide adenylyltransferase [Komagataeibacter rhaeticus]|uniref:Probable nicotinate-nucleotide adenylyltransferase n=1 Tax=Komagataeibacter rhaeticus TaxID=215221 RepID=A0A181C7C8_9PROT|nr:nicotinate-nucleotide adenylyltransferase [Komagataeibacter rhaeticus]ATU73696.1 nicotinate-nucleotide adenylyltransferase [Komagataeibacter xylinus]KDU94964.1 nicotinate-nucleotide adenylyltransferase [Komagataeibacter rhaeticus AF1]MBL7239879.1 nicotinate-nucleotide adenylyltransferase [Komagataeibacter rhaeticus]PYD55265.1 nicotinate-nicotinamide nucleotide adenylyltransferase [Komagataeibacter rhaeticus]QIP34401.1 nicotinate-nucleotide adenylyltransferase [Komagataeibacter rhaeticus]